MPLEDHVTITNNMDAERVEERTIEVEMSQASVIFAILTILITVFLVAYRLGMAEGMLR